MPTVKGRKAAMQIIISADDGVAGSPSRFAPTVRQHRLSPRRLLIVFARLLQGFATGGQYAIATSFLVEVAPPGRKGLVRFACTQIGLRPWRRSAARCAGMVR
jgi:MHS family proline/betaine transporter-like MFS transporter